MKRILPFAAVLMMGASQCSKPLEKNGPAGDPAETPTAAFYMVQQPDYEGATQPGQDVEDLSQYGFLVCNASLDPDDVRAGAAPGAVVLAYVSIHQYPLWGENEFWNSYRALYSDTDFWLNASGVRISTWANTHELLYTESNAQKLAGFCLERLQGFDGLYLDDLFSQLPNTILTVLPVTPAEWPAVQNDWARFRDAFVRTVQASGYDKPLVANCGYPSDGIAHLNLAGVCSEEWWPAKSDDLIAGFRRYDPMMCVSWEWDAGNAARQGNIRYR